MFSTITYHCLYNMYIYMYIYKNILYIYHIYLCIYRLHYYWKTMIDLNNARHTFQLSLEKRYNLSLMCNDVQTKAKDEVQIVKSCLSLECFNSSSIVHQFYFVWVLKRPNRQRSRDNNCLNISGEGLELDLISKIINFLKNWR